MSRGEAVGEVSIEEVDVHLQGKKIIYPASNATFTYSLTAPVTVASNKELLASSSL